MSRTLAAAELFVLAWAVFLLLSCSLWSALLPRLLDSVQRWEPARRHLTLWLLCAAPALTTCALFASALLPSGLSLLRPALDHCLVHDDAHAHLCFVHLPRHAPHVAVWTVVAFVATLSTFALAAAGRRLMQSLRSVRALVRTSRQHEASRAYVLESDLTFCATTGLFFPRILISDCLLRELDEPQRHALIAHEQSHARRRDVLTRLLARVLSALYPSGLRDRLRRALDVAAEQACDEAAAEQVGDRLVVAEAIVHVERAMSAGGAALLGPGALGMGQLGIEQRVEALLGPPNRQGNLRVVSMVGLASCYALWLGSDRLHHVVESLLSPLLH